MNGSVGQHAGGPTDAAKENAARAAGVKRVDEREQSHATPLTLSHLWKPPVVRQYMQGDVLHKENVERKPSQFELALDLAYAGIVHILAEVAAEEHNGLALARFLLTFFPSFSIWLDVRNYVNLHGTDDIKMRTYIMATIILLFGYTANAAGIELPHAEGEEAEPYGEVIHTAVRSAVAFYLVAKGIRLLLYIEYAHALPAFRKPLLASGAALFLNAIVFYFPLIFIHNTAAIIALPTLAIVFDVFARFGLGLAGKFQTQRRMRKSKDSTALYPAFNLEHLIERTTQLVVVILGEWLILTTYIAGGREIGAHQEFGRSALSVIIALTLLWLYFDADSSRAYIHALRRHWVSSVSFNILHFFLPSALIIASASLTYVIPEEEVPQSLLWYLSGGIAATLACIALIGVLHRGMDQHRSGLIPRSVRLALRFLGSVLIAVMPLFGPERTTAYLGIVAGILVAILIVETLGKLGAVRVDLEASISGSRRAVKSHESSQKHWQRHESQLTANEKGEEDVGMETELGDMETLQIHPTQKSAYAA